MPWFVFQDDPLQETIVDYLAALSKKKKKPILAGGNGGPYTEKMIKLIEANKRSSLPRSTNLGCSCIRIGPMGQSAR